MAMKKEKRGRWKAEGSNGGRANREDYSENDGRLDPDECEHTQFLDLIVVGQQQYTIGRCLDCGHAIYSLTKKLFNELPEPLLDDDTLSAQRAAHRSIWFGGVLLPEGVSLGK